MARRTLFVGDVHGCSRELKKLLKKTRPTRVILVGDLFTKGPDPAGVWKLIRKHDAEAVLGNHDIAVLDQHAPGDLTPGVSVLKASGARERVRRDAGVPGHE